jgi:hypothetical protein
MLGRLSAMDDPILWRHADVRWSPEGYVLEVPIQIDERTAYECRSEVASAVRDALAEHDVASINISPAESRPGELEIVTRQMIDATEAVELREALLRVLQHAVNETDEAVAEDEQAKAFVLAALRQPPA